MANQIDCRTFKDLPSTMVNSLEILEKAWNTAGLPDPFVYADFDEDLGAYNICASWMRYDIIIHILEDGRWLIIDCSKSCSTVIPSNNNTSFLQTLKTRIQMDPVPGKSVTDMSDWKPVWRESH